VKLYSGYNNGKKIVFTMDTASRSVPNIFGNTVWLKLERNGHELTGYYSGDGKAWVSLGRPINAVKLDETQPNYNSWVGTSVGLFAEGKPADFDCFICKDGSSSLPAASYSNYYGIATVNKGIGKTVTNTSIYGGWFMISGVEIGRQSASSVQVVASSKGKGKLQIWLDDLQNGKLIATIPLNATGSGNYKIFSKQLKNVTGQHDVFVRYPAGVPQSIFIKSIRFPGK
jgi:xylan 1,4-beta-xylosidase